MSVDGPGILGSDLAHDVYNEILDLCDAGTPISELRARVANYEESLVNDLDKEIYLAASAKVYWEIGHLPGRLRTQLSRLVEGGTSLELWAQSGNETLAKARKTALHRLLRQIAKPRSRTRPRKKYPTVRTKLFAVGDCLELIVGERTYRGVVCKILEYRGQCEYATLVMGPDTTATSESFGAGRYYGRRIPSTLDTRGYTFGPHVIRLDHRILVRASNPFQIVGHVELDEATYCLGSFSGVLNMNDVVEDFQRTEINPRCGYELLLLRQLMRKESATE